jgi:hypothetical protein
MKVDHQTYVCRLSRTKSYQAGTDHNVNADKPITGPAAEVLTAWLGASGVHSGPILTRPGKMKAVEPLVSTG